MVNHYECSFRSSGLVRLSDQHPETGSIPGSSTGWERARTEKSWPVSRFGTLGSGGDRFTLDAT